MLSKRLIVCLDVRDGKVTKGVRFKGNVEVGEPVTMAEEYYRQGVDELVFYDITASAEGRPIDIEMVREVARRQSRLLPAAPPGATRPVIAADLYGGRLAA